MGYVYSDKEYSDFDYFEKIRILSIVVFWWRVKEYEVFFML